MENHPVPKRKKKKPEAQALLEEKERYEKRMNKKPKSVPFRPLPFNFPDGATSSLDEECAHILLTLQKDVGCLKGARLDTLSKRVVDILSKGD